MRYRSYQGAPCGAWSAVTEFDQRASKIEVTCTSTQLSRAVNGVLYGPKFELIREKADKILTRIEKEKGVKNYVCKIKRVAD